MKRPGSYTPRTKDDMWQAAIRLRAVPPPPYGILHGIGARHDRSGPDPALDLMDERIRGVDDSYLEM